MLERYFLRPATVDQVRASWIVEPSEQYVAWLTERGYGARNVHARVPIPRHFGDFAREHGATTRAELPAHVTSFVEAWLRDREGNGQILKAAGVRE
jgi:integrase/recombinase XerD